MSRTVKLSAGDVAFLREVTVDMTTVLAEEAEHGAHREKREWLLALLLRLIGDRA